MMRLFPVSLILAVLGISVAALADSTPAPAPVTAPATPAADQGINKIKHIIVIMQENRSFDQYFGTFPGADGIPMQDGVPTVCLPDPVSHQCIAPFHDPNVIDRGGPHNAEAAARDIDGGKMDGFVISAREMEANGCRRGSREFCDDLKRPPDAMGWHDGRDIPHYWEYAQQFVLQDHMFEPNASWSLPSHLFMVSAWSGYCLDAQDPSSCSNALDGPPEALVKQIYKDPSVGGFAWTDLTYLLHQHGVSWAYYLMEGLEPDCEDDETDCEQQPQTMRVLGIWNPLPGFSTVKDDGELGNIRPVQDYIQAAKDGTLPSVCWIVPAQPVSEHGPAPIGAGEKYVTALVNAAMRGPDWDSTVIFLAWDDWGGYYDHVRPPKVDQNGYGLRVPGLVISPYAKRGYIDHQTLSFDAYLKFIEDRFLGGARIDPATDGRPDPRPSVRESARELGDLTQDFDFDQPPRPPLILDTDWEPPAPAAPPPGGHAPTPDPRPVAPP